MFTARSVCTIMAFGRQQAHSFGSIDHLSQIAFPTNASYPVDIGRFGSRHCVGLTMDHISKASFPRPVDNQVRKLEIKQCNFLLYFPSIPFKLPRSLFNTDEMRRHSTLVPQ